MRQVNFLFGSTLTTMIARHHCLLGKNALSLNWKPAAVQRVVVVVVCNNTALFCSVQASSIKVSCFQYCWNGKRRSTGAKLNAVLYAKKAEEENEKAQLGAIN